LVLLVLPTLGLIATAADGTNQGHAFGTGLPPAEKDAST
jgi:hypothetical protein